MNWLAVKQQRTGFTLIEIMIVVGIIGILAAVVTLNVRDSSASSRDAKRQADLRLLQTAIETYKNENGRYPEGCRGANEWSGQLDTNYVCNSAVSSTYAGTGQYIIGLAPKYISVLPVDPKLNGTDSGYMYMTNADRTVYKLRAYKTVEAEVVTRNHPLKACDIRVEQAVSGTPATVSSKDPRVIGWCAVGLDSASAWVHPVTTNCNEHNPLFQSTYATWGGQAPLVLVGGINVYAADPLEIIAPIVTPPPSAAQTAEKNRNRVRAIVNTTDIICK